jgi:hypothetical protein
MKVCLLPLFSMTALGFAWVASAAAAGNTPDFVFIAGLKEAHLNTPEPEAGIFMMVGLGIIWFFRRSFRAARRETAAELVDV